ncbi:MAG: type II secretion system protein [Candidatus Gottesmanbacteria bacterium]
MTNKKGFTLIELLVVIGILAILLAITLIAINPARQFGQANNTRRRSDVLQILNAVHQYAAENNGQLPPEVSALTATAGTVLSGANFPNLCGELMTNYMPALPTDPSLNSPNITSCTATTWNTGYAIMKDAEGRVTVSATGDLGATISVTR